MKVGINGRLLYECSMRGWNRYLLNLLFELLNLEVEIIIYSERSVHPAIKRQLGNVSYRASGRRPYPYWEQIWLPWAAAQDRIDLYHTPIHYGVPALIRCPVVMTLHDTISDQYYRDRPGYRLKWGERKFRMHEQLARKRADRIITVSDFSKADIVSYYGIPAEIISVIKEAADPRFNGSAAISDLPEELHAKPYFFYVGGYEPRKNISFLIDAFVKLNHPDALLVLAGNHAQFPIVEHPRIICLGEVDDDILKSLYAYARAFIYPSFYEGFGLQLCEAMAMSCPVLASDRTSLPEVLKNGGELFSLDSATGLVDLMQKVLSDESYFQSLRERAKHRSLDFSWSKTAQETLALYQNLLGSV